MELKLSFFLFNESLITRARNYLVDEFLRCEDFTHLLFIDSDIHYNPQDIVSIVHEQRSIRIQRNQSIGVTYLHASRNHPDLDPKELEGLVGEYVFNVVKGTQQFQVTEPLEVMKVELVFMLVQRQGI